jgi:hypothetical protein
VAHNVRVTGTGADQGDIDWLDEPPAARNSEDSPEPAPTDAEAITNPRRRVQLTGLVAYWRYAAVAVVALLVGGAVAAVALPRHSTAARTASSSGSSVAPATPRPSEPAANGSVSSAAAAAPVGAISTANSSPPLAGAPSSWNLFARGPGVVIRFELARGTTTTTTVPQLQSFGPVAFVAGADRIIVRPLDSVPGFAVDDSGAIAPLTGALVDGGDAVAGPDLQHLWVQNLTSAQSSMQLVDLAGAPAGPTISIPDQGGSPTSDDAGGLLFASIDGIFTARPGSTARVTTGALVAVGPTRWLAEECDDHLQCGLTVIDRSTGTRRALAPSSGAQFQLSGGQISPDGRTAAVVGVDPAGGLAVHLLDLSTGQDTATPLTIDQDDAGDDALFVWSPDSRWLFSIDAGGVSVIDRSSGQRQVLVAGQPQLNQLAFRAG